MKALQALQALTADQQVALLFLTLFGSLALATVGLLVWTIRREEDPRLGPLKRDLGALWVAAAVFWLAWISGAVGATLLFGVLSSAVKFGLSVKRVHNYRDRKMLDAERVVDAVPRYDSIQHFGLGAAYDSKGAAAGQPR